MERPKPTEADIAKVLADPVPEKRAQGLAAAGYHQMATFYDKVLDVALRGTGIERQAAVYALGFYTRDVPEGVLRQLIAADDAQLRFSALELATRRDAQRFTNESLDVVRAILGDMKGGPSSYEQERTPFVAALTADDPVLRRVVVVALELGGNPDAVPYLQPLANDPDPAVRESAASAIAALGPSKPTTR
jgi:HEAT repeat protein